MFKKPFGSPASSKISHFDGGDRCFFRRFQNDGVPRRNCWGDFMGRQIEWEIERRDGTNHANRFADRKGHLFVVARHRLDWHAFVRRMRFASSAEAMNV